MTGDIPEDVSGAVKVRPKGKRRLGPLDRRSPIPLYRQLADALDSAIDGMRPGDRLPGEPVITRSYGVSRTVVRQALDELASVGRVDRRQGIGTFVSRRRVEMVLFGSFDDLRGADQVEVAGPPGMEVLGHSEVALAPDIAEILQVAPGTTAVLIERLRSVTGGPCALTRTWIPAELVPGLTGAALREQSLYAVLEADHGLRLDHGRRWIDAVPAVATVAQVLDLSVGDPLLRIHSVSYLPAGRPVEYFEEYRRGDRARVDVHVRRRAAGPKAEDRWLS